MNNELLFEAVFGKEPVAKKEEDYLEIANSTRRLTKIEEYFYFSLLRNNEEF